MFSKACEYAVKASIFIAQQSQQDRRVNVKEVAKAVNAPEAFTAKLLQQLCRENILLSNRGKQGGFIFEVAKQKTTKLYDVVTIFDGDGLFTNCALGLQKCSALNPCPVHDDFKEVRDNLFIMVKKYTFYDLSLKIESGLAWLK